MECLPGIPFQLQFQPCNKNQSLYQRCPKDTARKVKMMLILGQLHLNVTKYPEVHALERLMS